MDAVSEPAAAVVPAQVVDTWLRVGADIPASVAPNGFCCGDTGVFAEGLVDLGDDGVGADELVEALELDPREPAEPDPRPDVEPVGVPPVLTASPGPAGEEPDVTALDDAGDVADEDGDGREAVAVSRSREGPGVTALEPERFAPLAVAGLVEELPEVDEEPELPGSAQAMPCPLATAVLRPMASTSPASRNARVCVPMVNLVSRRDQCA